MTPEFDRTSFGVARRREDAEKLAVTRKMATDRMLIVSDLDKLARLTTLLTAIDAVMKDLTT